MIKKIIKWFIPNTVLSVYHSSLSHAAALFYGHPSKKLIVIGVTGTNGKSTTVNLIATLLEKKGKKVGLTSTMNFKIAGKEIENRKKMTMLGRGALHRMMKEMVKKNCEYAVIETSSEGIAQGRHKGIQYDAMVFTNLTPEHIESHGSFEKYKEAKLKVFKHLASLPPKYIQGSLIKRGIAVNANDSHAPDFFDFNVPKKISFGFENNKRYCNGEPLLASNVSISERGSSFSLNGKKFETTLVGLFNVANILAALAAVKIFGIHEHECTDTVYDLQPLPGRMEKIDEGQPFKVIVDYAYEPAGVRAIYETLEHVDYKRLIHILGSAGGGRDVARRPVLGNLAGEKADIVIVTNEDPYDEDPRSIIEAVAEGAEHSGKIKGKNLFLIDERRDAIGKALSLAEINDLVLITGKGSEPVMAVKEGSIPWDDRKVTKELLKPLVEKL